MLKLFLCGTAESETIQKTSATGTSKKAKKKKKNGKQQPAAAEAGATGGSQDRRGNPGRIPFVIHSGLSYLFFHF